MNTVSTLKFLLGATAVSAIVSAMATPAHALSFTTTPDQTSTVAGAQTADFETLSTPAGISYSSGGKIISGVAGDYTAPSGDSTNYLTLNSPGIGASNSTTISSSNELDYFGLYWGSIDAYNTVSFLKGGVTIGTFTGADILGVLADGTRSLYVNFTAGAGESFDQILLASSSPAFESDNHAFRSVPTPALLPGLFGLAVGVLRKRRSEVAEESKPKA